MQSKQSSKTKTINHPKTKRNFEFPEWQKNIDMGIESGCPGE